MINKVFGVFCINHRPNNALTYCRVNVITDFLDLLETMSFPSCSFISFFFPEPEQNYHKLVLSLFFFLVLFWRITAKSVYILYSAYLLK